MKRLLIVVGFFALLVFSLVFSSTAKAQGTFYCLYNISSDVCNVDASRTQCDQGCNPDYNRCFRYNNSRIECSANDGPYSCTCLTTENSYSCSYNISNDSCNVTNNQCSSGCVPIYENCFNFNGNRAGCSGAGTFTCSCNTPPSDANGINWGQLYTSIQTRAGAFSMNRNLTIGRIITGSLTYIFAFAGLLLLILLIYGGITYLTSAGNEQSLAKAKGIITSALTGFVIVFVAFWLVQIIARVLGISQIFSVF